MMTTPLLETLARSTWRLLALSQRNRVLMGEDAITSFNLNLLATSAKVLYCEDTRIDEVNRGCDFELWIGDDRRGWARYAVQAKKLTLSTGRYAGLLHLVGRRRQLDILEEFAHANRATPVYCFYNYSREKYSWSCGLPRETEQLGCSVAPANVVHQSIASRGGRTFAWIHGHADTIPWRCLSACPRLLNASATCGTQKWLSLDAHTHPRLPESLARLRDHAELTITNLAEASDLFNQGIPFRPARLAVFNLEDQVTPPNPRQSEDWFKLTSLLSPRLFSAKLDRAGMADLLSPFKSQWGMNDDIFELYVDACTTSAHLLSEPEFMASLSSLGTSDPKTLKSILLYLLQNITR